MAINFEQIPNPIEAGQIIRAGHVSQSLVAFSGLDAYNINLSGSFAMTGSIYHIEIDDAAGVASSVLVRDNTTGEYYTTGSYGGGGGGGAAGSSGSSGTSGADGSSGSSGTSGVGTDGSSGSSGTSGVGTDGSSGSSGTSGVGTDGSSGSSGTSGIAGSSGSSGTSGIAGSSGSSGTSGDSGSSGSSGTSGIGTDGSSGSSGTSGVGTDGSSGSSGTSGAAGSSGSSGTSGEAGSSGSSGTSGAAGSSGSSGTSGLLSNQPMYDIATRSTSGPGFPVDYSFIAGTTVITTGNQKVTVSIGEIAGLILGDEVHITATANGNETSSYPNIIVAAAGWTSGLPFTINGSGDITFFSSIAVPATGLFVMYHIMYTTDEIPG